MNPDNVPDVVGELSLVLKAAFESCLSASVVMSLFGGFLSIDLIIYQQLDN